MPGFIPFRQVLATSPVAVRPSIVAATHPDWLPFAENHGATAFHHPAWSSVLADAYGYEAGVVALVSSDGRVHAGLPFMDVRSRLTGSRRVALPFTDHSPALCTPGLEIELVNALRDWASVGGPVKVHARLPGEDRHLVCAGVRHLLQLDDAETMRARLSKTPVGRALRKAGKSELTTTIERDLGAVRAYYRLHCLTRRRQGVPVQPWRFFRLLHQRLVAEGLGMVVLARFRGRPVAGAVFLSWNSTLIYKYGASDPAFLELRPNNLVMWQAIEWGSANGCRILDFGKTDTYTGGLRRFKSGWGAQEVPHHHTVLPDGAGPERSGLAMRAASHVIRRSPVVAARAIGELLYGHFA
jgi:CelD/BcsL family acetyltransferase involved in cellulose biosynthesis